MRKIFSGTIFILLICLMTFYLYSNSSRFDFENINKDISGKIKIKGIKDINTITFDTEDKVYFSNKEGIGYIDSGGKLSMISNKKNVTDMKWFNGDLYFISGNKLIVMNLLSKEEKVLINNIPNYGDYKNSKLLIKDNFIYVTIGTATNSGVVGTDNPWRNDGLIYDITPKTITLKGKNFGDDNTGAFMPYKTKSEKDQVIKGSLLGNGSVIRLGIKDKRIDLYCWGIRNIEGIDYNSQGKIIAAVGGMEERGSRPIAGDKDYIYELISGQWYGWPDYSGGDPVTSPRFRNDKFETATFILDKHPTVNPPAPFYQHTDNSSLSSLTVDRAGSILKKDSIFFYDKKFGTLYNISKEGILTTVAKLKNDTNICYMTMNKNSLFLVDKGNGCVYEVQKTVSQSFKVERKIVFFCIVTLISIFTALIIKIKR